MTAPRMTFAAYCWLALALVAVAFSINDREAQR